MLLAKQDLNSRIYEPICSWKQIGLEIVNGINFQFTVIGIGIETNPAIKLFQALVSSHREANSSPVQEDLFAFHRH